MMNNNKNLLTEVSRIHSLMGVEKKVLLEHGGLDDLLELGIKQSSGLVDNALTRAIRNNTELFDAIKTIDQKNLSIASKMDELITTTIKLGDKKLADDIIDTFIASDTNIFDNWFEMIDYATKEVKDLVGLGKSVDDAVNDVTKKYADKFKESEIFPNEFFDKFIRDFDSKLKDLKITPPKRTARITVDNPTGIEEILNPNLTIDDLLKRKLEDLPKFTKEQRDRFTKTPKWTEFISRIKSDNIITRIFRKQTELIEETQGILETLLNREKLDLGQPSVRRLEERMKRNLLDLYNFSRTNEAYRDFYNWADILFSNKNNPKEIQKWWAKLKKNDGFVIINELANKGTWADQFGRGFKEGALQNFQSTKNLWVRIIQYLNPIRQTKQFINAIAKLRKKKLPFDIESAKPEQRSALKKYFWSGNPTGYEGFFKYMAEHGFIAASARLLGQFGRGYLLSTVMYTVIEIVLQGGLEGDEKGIYDINDSRLTKARKLAKAVFIEYWDNIIGMKYVVPAWTLGKPVLELIYTIVDAWMASGGSVSGGFSEWAQENIPFYSAEANNALENNPNNNSGATSGTTTSDTATNTGEVTAQQLQQLEYAAGNVEYIGNGRYKDVNNTLYKFEDDEWIFSVDNGQTWTNVY